MRFPTTPRIALGLILSMTLSTAALAAEYEWTFQTSAQAGDNFFPIQQNWAKQVAEKTDGRIQIEVVPVGTVVQYNETLEAVGTGILQGHITDPSYFAGKDAAFGMLGNLVGGMFFPGLAMYCAHGSPTLDPQQIQAVNHESFSISAQPSGNICL